MSARDDGLLEGVLIGAGLTIGALALAEALKPAAAPRDSFLGRVRDSLRRRQVELASAELVNVGGTPSWVVTLRLPERSVLTVRATLPHGADPFSEQAANDVARRTLRYLDSKSLLAG